MLADILPTSYEVGVLNGHITPGDVVAVVGAGPIGLSAMLTAQLLSPTPHHRDRPRGCSPSRPQSASAPMWSSTAGARMRLPWCASSQAVLARMSPSRRSAFQQRLSSRQAWCDPAAASPISACTGKPATLHLETLWTRDVTITTGLVDTFTTPTLIRLLAGGRLPSNSFITQRFALDEMLAAYDTFGRASETGALKVVLTAANASPNGKVAALAGAVAGR